jgi:hypothetical protein
MITKNEASLTQVAPPAAPEYAGERRSGNTSGQECPDSFIAPGDCQRSEAIHFSVSAFQFSAFLQSHTSRASGFAIPHRNRNPNPNRNPNRRLLSEFKGTGDKGLGTGD